MGTELFEKTQEMVPADTTALATVMEGAKQQEIQGRLIVAMNQRRNKSLALKEMEQTLAIPKMAEEALYAYRRGSQIVTGFTIRAAEIMASEWGNMEYGFNVLESSKDHSVIESFAWDLQTNMRKSISFKVRHWRDTKTGGYPLKDERDIYELQANMASRRTRACILPLIPGWIRDQLMLTVQKAKLQLENEETANMTKEERIEYFAGKRRWALDFFRENYGATEEMLVKLLEKKVAQWDVGDLVKLKDIIKSVQSEDCEIGTFIPELSGKKNVQKKDGPPSSLDDLIPDDKPPADDKVEKPKRKRSTKKAAEPDVTQSEPEKFLKECTKALNACESAHQLPEIYQKYHERATELLCLDALENLLAERHKQLTEK